MNITISVGTIVKVALTLAALWVFYIVRELALVILSSVVLASAIEPMVVGLTRRGISRTLAVLMIYVLAFVIIIGLVYFLLPPLLVDFGNITASIPERLQSLSDWGKSLSPLGGMAVDIAGNLTVNDLIEVLRASLSGATSGALGAASIIFGGILSFVLIIVISFYLAVQEDGVENVLRVVTPSKHEPYVIDVWRRSQKKIGLWMQGQIFLGIFIGIFVYLGLALMGIKYALLLAILAGIFELIPYVGPTLSAAPAVLLGFNDGLVTGLLVLGFFIIIQQFENHLLYPLVVKKMVGVPALMVIISMIIGAKLAGFLGILIAVPVAAVFMELLSDWEKKKHVFAERVAGR